MGKFRAVKKLIFIAIIIFVAAYLYNNAHKMPKGPQETKEKPEAIETPAVPEPYEDVKPEIKLSGSGEEQKILSFDMTGYTRDGKKKWDIKGKSADIVSDTVILNEIEANAYSEDRTVVLSAKSGEYDRKENSIRFQENVIVTTSDGVCLKAEWFQWNSETDKIITNSFVEVEIFTTAG